MRSEFHYLSLLHMENTITINNSRQSNKKINKINKYIKKQKIKKLKEKNIQTYAQWK